MPTAEKWYPEKFRLIFSDRFHTALYTDRCTQSPARAKLPSASAAVRDKDTDARTYTLVRKTVKTWTPARGNVLFYFSA